MKKIVYVLSGIALFSTMIVFWQSNKTVTFQELQANLDKAYIMQKNGKIGIDIPDFQLRDDNGKRFQKEQLLGKWSLAFFGFTYCPDICITKLHLLSKVQQALAKQQTENIPQVYFVSVDPMRDTTEKLKNYMQFFNPNFIGVTGDFDQLSKFMKPLGAYHEYSYVENGKTKNTRVWAEIPEKHLEKYLVNHTAWIYLINPEGKLIASIPASAEGETMVKDLKLILSTSLPSS
jgi:protein SCO1/2